jgi:hypothetical protein
MHRNVADHLSCIEERRMKKLKKLKLDKIEVLSFEVAGTEGSEGTVQAHSYTYESGVECEPTGIQYSCYSCPAPPWCDVQPLSTYC